MSPVALLVMVFAPLLLLTVWTSDAQVHKSREDALWKTAGQKIAARVLAECGSTTPFTVVCNGCMNVADFADALLATAVRLIVCQNSSIGAAVYPKDFRDNPPGASKLQASSLKELERALVDHLYFICFSSFKPNDVLSSLYVPFSDGSEGRLYGKTFGSISALQHLLAQNQPKPPPPPPPPKLLSQAKPYAQLIDLLSPRFHAFLRRCTFAAIACPDINSVFCLVDVQPMPARFSLLQLDIVAKAVADQLAAAQSLSADAADSFALEIQAKAENLFRAICAKRAVQGRFSYALQKPAEFMQTLKNRAAEMP